MFIWDIAITYVVCFLFRRNCNVCCSLFRFYIDNWLSWFFRFWIKREKKLEISSNFWICSNFFRENFIQFIRFSFMFVVFSFVYSFFECLLFDAKHRNWNQNVKFEKSKNCIVFILFFSINRFFVITFINSLFETFMWTNRTHSIKKCSINSLDANDRSRRILINTKISFLKIDKFNQYLIQVFNRDIRQNHLKCVSIIAIVTHVAFKSTITYNFQLID